MRVYKACLIYRPEFTAHRCKISCASQICWETFGEGKMQRRGPPIPMIIRGNVETQLIDIYK